MYDLRTCLVLLLFFFFSLFHSLSCSSSKEEEWCEALFQCGKITAGFPFWGRNRNKHCNHPLLELHCDEDNITSLDISNQKYYVLQINQTSYTLTLVRADHMGSFCFSEFINTALPPEIFELSPNYKSLNVFYHCFSLDSQPLSHGCPRFGRYSISQNHGYNETCHFNVTVNFPKSFISEEKESSLKILENVLRKGFEVKVKIDKKACQDCSSSHEFCDSNETFPGPKCSPLHQPSANDELHRRCSTPFSCGDQKNLSYPFWIAEREECGHPKFKLDCGGGIAEISISSVKFRILEANYTSRIIRLARSDFINNTCPKYPVDESFDENVLPFAPDTEMLTIYYDCNLSFSPSLTTFGEKLVCPDDDTDKKTNYYVTRNISSTQLQPIRGQLTDLWEICDRHVSIPANGPALTRLQRTPSADNLKKALTYGFELGLNQECLKCIDSMGACGYNLSSNQFACYQIENKGLSTEAKIGVTAAASGVGLVILIVAGWFCFIRRRRKTQEAQYTSKDFPVTSLYQQNLKPIISQPKLEALIPLKQYSYIQVKRITNSFAEVVGRGGFGTVYRGTFCDGRIVAVKVLKETKGNNGEDFINEVASMSQTSHVNIVTLLGFCSEGSNRAIIYEFLENGSLDKFLSSKISMSMDWMTLYGIALGVARALEYLHHGCRTRIVHFDIKPQNVLLDDNLSPKVSDFGLAKLCERKESILSLLDTRGTIGYIAPEVFSSVYGRVSHKSDVYSYGMLVLEMIGARNKTSILDTASSTSSMYFPEWIYKDLEKRETRRLIENGISSEEDEIAKKMTLVGLWCIQPWPSDRPAMNIVLEMMEGSVDALEVPPRPVLQCSVVPHLESSWISEESSISSKI